MENKEKKSCPLWVTNSGRWHRGPIPTPLRHARYHYLKKLILLFIYFPVARCLSTWKCWCFFLGNWWVRTTAKTMVVDRNKQKALALLYLASGSLWNAANSSVVPTAFAAKLTTKMNSSKKNFVTWTLLNFFFPLIDIWYFFSGSKLHFCRTESFC